MPELEVLADYACETGECPTWHAEQQCLYWTDIPQGRLFRWHRETGEHEQVYSGRPVGGMTVQADGKLLLFMDRGSVAIWDGSRLEFVIESLPQEEETRFNDVIADPQGRVFCGTMRRGETPGRLYRLDTDGSIEMVMEGTKTSNGMGFTPDLKQFYFTDSGPATIFRFDYDQKSGEISEPQVFVSVDRSIEGATDGMTVDIHGFVWSARWDGSRLVRHDSTGKEVERIDFPVKKVSSCQFGGPDYDELFVTTAGGNDKAANGEHAGALYRLKPGVRGRPEFLSRIGL